MFRVEVSSIPLGWPGFLLAIAVLGSGIVVATRPAVEPADQVVWTFTQAHADALQSTDDTGITPIGVYEQATGRSVAVHVIEPRAMDLRLLALLEAGRAEDLPDVVMLEVNSAVKFLDRPAEDRGLIDLNKYLSQNSLGDSFLPSRLGMWQRDGITYGLPLDVHPVALAYRVDLWHAAGIDPASAETWPQFVEAAEQFIRYWRDHGHPERRALELSTATSEHLTLLLQQRGLKLVDASGDPRLDEPEVLDTIIFIARLAAGRDAIARATSRGHGRWARDFEVGDVATLWMPDWRAALLEEAAPALAGNVGLMPLPVFDRTDLPTATWGGTMVAIPDGVEDVEAAWELASFIATSDAALEGRRRSTGLVPPLVRTAGKPSRTGSYFANGSGALFSRLADDVPATHPSGLDLAAGGHLSLILSATVADLESELAEDEIDRRLAERLSAAQQDLLRRQEHFGGP